jgi:hypothetical protein
LSRRRAVRRASVHQWFSQKIDAQRFRHHVRRPGGSGVPHHAQPPGAGRARAQAASSAALFGPGFVVFTAHIMPTRRIDCYTFSMSSSVAAEYIRTHRADCSDKEIRRALKEQGFTDALLDEAFDDAGPRKAAPPAPRGKRALLWALIAVSALCFVAAGALFVRNLSRAAGALAHDRER